MKRNLLFAAMTLIAALWSTKAYAQEDITADYLVNADLSTVNSGWTYGSTVFKNGGYEDWKTDGDVAVVEFYSQWNAGAPVAITQKDFKFSQTITLPAGDYRIAVNAFYRNGNGDGTNPDKAWIFAGEKTQNVAALTSAGVASYTGSNDLYKAANAFSLGNFSNAFDFTLEEETTIEVGFQGFFNTSLSWCILGPVKLYKYSIDDYLTDYRSKVAEAEALYDDPMSGTALDELMSNVVDESTLHTGAEVAEAIANLNTAILAAQQSVALYKKLDEAIAAAETIETEAVANGATDITYIADVRTDYQNGDIEDEDVDLVIETLNAEVVEMAKTQTANYSDMTIVADYLPWTCEQGNGPNPYAGTATETYLESSAGYNPGKVMYKHIEGLQPGTYEVKFYATANMAWVGAPTGSDIAQVYANDQTLDIDVIGQTACTITDTDYERSFFTCEVGEDGVLEFGLQNVGQGGNWYVAQVISLTLVELAQEVKPTSVDITISDAIPFEEQYLATYCSPYDLDFTDVEGITAYTAVKAYEEGYAGQTITGLKLSPIAQVPAGMPVLLKADAAQTYTVPVPEEALPAIDLVNELAVADADLDLFDAVTTSEYGEFVSGPAVLDFKNVMTGIDYDTFDYIYEDVAGFFPCAKPAAAEAEVLEAGTVYLPITGDDAYEAMTNPYIKLNFTDKPIEVVEVENIAGLYALNGENIEVALTLTDAQITKIAGDKSYNYTIIEDASGAALFQNLGVYGIVNEGEVLNGTLNLKANVGEVFGIKVQQFTASERTMESDLMIATGTAEPTAVTDENIDDWAASFNWRYVSMENVPFTLEEGDVPTVTFYDIPFSVQDLFAEGIELPSEACNVNLSGFFAEYQGSYIFVPATIEAVEEGEVITMADETTVPVIESTTVNVVLEPQKAYSEDTAEFDTSFITEMFGIESMADVQTYWLDREWNATVPVYGGGTIDGWRNAEGAPAQWSESTNGMCVKIEDPASGIINYIGAHDTNFQVGDEYVADYAFVYDNQAVILNIVINFEEKQAPEIVLDFVGEINLEATLLAGVNYDNDGGCIDANHHPELIPTFDVAEVAEMLGVEDIADAKVYIVNADDKIVENDPVSDWWRDGEGNLAAWNTEDGFCAKLNNPASGQIDYVGTVVTTHEAGTSKVARFAVTLDDAQAVMIVLTINWVDQDVWTGIDNIFADKNGEQTIYDLSGRRVRTITKGGMYIVNGKKVFVK